MRYDGVFNTDDLAGNDGVWQASAEAPWGVYVSAPQEGDFGGSTFQEACSLPQSVEKMMLRCAKD